MNKIEKQIINAKRQVWHEEKKAEFKALFPDVVELDEEGNELESFSETFGSWLNELEQYEVTTTEVDDEGNEFEATNTYKRKVRPMPNFTVTQADLDAKAIENYAELRASAYPPIGDQLDMQYKDITNGTTNWIDLISSIKSKYPKVI